MQSSIEKLRKFFRLENENGYQNKAVIGGLAKILEFWEAEARNETVSEDIISLVSARLRDYHRLTPTSRAETLKGLWKRIQGQAGAGEIPEPIFTENEPERKPVPAKAINTPEKSSASAQPQRSEAPQREPYRPPQQREQQERKVAPRSSSFPGAQTSQTPAALNASLTVLHGVGPKNSSKLEKLGLYTLGDMLYFFPRRYDDYSKLKPIKALFYGDVVTVIGQVQSVSNRTLGNTNRSMVEVILSDGMDSLRVTWFNQPWLSNRFSKGVNIAVAGKIEQYLGRLVMNNPYWEPVEIENLHTNRIVPIYPLTENVTQKSLRELMDTVIRFWTPRVSDPLPVTLIRDAKLMGLGEALYQVHFPDDQDRLTQSRDRLAFDEIFYLQMGVLRQKKDWNSVDGRVFETDQEWLNSVIDGLPYQLTNAQRRTIEDIQGDLRSGKPMNRLIQGDVGSGKTIVAAMAAMFIIRNGAQAAIMAPTSILAEQHFKSLSQTMIGAGLLMEGEIKLLTGDTNTAERETIKVGLENGDIKILIGTHALIEDPVTFKDLQLTVIDEQHRFGVGQRSALRAKGNNPHLLVMTATPIPRSLALTLYGDLDLSVMDEMPAGRQPISTHVLRPQERERAYSLVRSQIMAGKQAFIVYPLIEESEKLETVKAAVDDHERLSNDIFSDLKVGLLHGKMKPEEKDRIMTDFRDGIYQILVSTTVIEVGVDVPNATVILIEGANRFGLAQLHQLRGRVGRGGGESFCLLIPDHEDAAENERLQVMTETSDGFKLAEMDLKLRGPGEFLGTRQSGFAGSLKMVSLTDIALIEKASAFAKNIFETDAELILPENKMLSEALDRFWGVRSDIS
jgi:ATP-dependent DNA helicase RecG